MSLIKKLKTISLSAVFLSTIPLSSKAEIVSLDIKDLNPDKFVNAYHKYYKKELSFNLFASKAEHNHAIETRALLLKYCNENEINASDYEIDLAWQDYVRKNYNSPADLEKKLKNSYIDLEFVKFKFLENLDLEKYFTEIVKPRIIKDFELRKKIIRAAYKEKLAITNEGFNLALNQFIANLGGAQKFKAFLDFTSMSVIELTFYIKSELLKKELVDKMVFSDNKNANANQKSLNNRIKNYYKNSNQVKNPKYYFKQAFIYKYVEGAYKKILEAKKYFDKEKLIKRNNRMDRRILVYDMQVPIDINSSFYNPDIKAKVLELSSDDELFINDAVSDIFETANGYHVVQISKVDVDYEVSFEEAYNLIYKKYLEANLSELDKLLDKN